MKTTHDTIGGHALIVLNELDGTHLLIELTLREGLEEITSSILEDTRLYDNYAIEGGFYYFHVWVGCWLLAVGYWLFSLLITHSSLFLALEKTKTMQRSCSYWVLAIGS